MSYKTRLARLEKIGVGDKVWALIGVGRPRDAQQQRLLEMQARDGYYASGGDRDVYIAFLPFDCFDSGFMGYITKCELTLQIMNKTKNPAEFGGTPS